MLRNLRFSRRVLPTAPRLPPVSSTRAFTFILSHPQLRAYAASHAEPCVTTRNAPGNEVASKIFAGLETWSKCLDSPSQVSVWIKDQPTHHIEVSSTLLRHVIVSESKARTRVQWPQPYSWNVPVLDLREYDKEPALIFLFWLYKRRLPHLERDCGLSTGLDSTKAQRRIYTTAARRLQEAFAHGLTDAWIIGASLRSPVFQNDVMRKLANALQLEEEEAHRSSDPNYSSAIAWARRAYDNGTTMPKNANIMPIFLSKETDRAPSTHSVYSQREEEVEHLVAGLEEDANIDAASISVQAKAHSTNDMTPVQEKMIEEEDICRPLREFAVDVAAKRVCDVGYDGQLLTLAERRALSGNEAFAEEVFAALGGHMGAGGVEVTEFARGYLVREAD